MTQSGHGTVLRSVHFRLRRCSYLLNIRQLPGPICDISARSWWVSRSTGVGLEDLFKLLAFDAADRDPKGTSPALFTHRLAVAQLWEKPSAVTIFCHRERERAISSSTLHSPPPANAR